MMKSKLLIIWPAFDPGKIPLFKFILENFSSTIVFVKKDGKEFSNKRTELGPLEIYARTGTLCFLNHRGFRFTDYSFVSFLMLIKDLYQVLREEPWKFVLFSTNNAFHTKIGFLLCKIMRIRCGVKVEDWIDYNVSNPLRKVYHQIGKSIIKMSDYAFPHGEASKKYCLTLGKSTDRVLIFPLVIPGYNVGQVRYREKIDKFVYCGRLIDEKDPFLLLEAFRIIQKNHSNIKLSIAGSGPLLPKMKAYVTNHGLDNHVAFSGAYRRDELPAILTSGSALILPSKREGWGMVVNEAASLGRPIIVSDAAGAAFDLVVNGKNGFVFKASNIFALVSAMEKLLKSSPERIISMQECSRSLFDKYNDFERVKSVIEEVLYM